MRKNYRTHIHSLDSENKGNDGWISMRQRKLSTMELEQQNIDLNLELQKAYEREHSRDSLTQVPFTSLEQLDTVYDNKANKDIIGSAVPRPAGISGNIVVNRCRIPITTTLRMIETTPVLQKIVNYVLATVASKIGFYENPADVEFQNMINFYLKQIKVDGKPDWFSLCKNIASAVFEGNHVDEIVYKYDSVNNMQFISDVIPLPVSSTGFYINDAGETQAVIQSTLGLANNTNAYNGASYASSVDFFAGNIVNQNIASSQSRPNAMFNPRITGGLSPLDRIIPVEKALITRFNFGTGSNNPFGNSPINSGYDYWKNSLLVMQQMVAIVAEQGAPARSLTYTRNMSYVDPKTKRQMNGLGAVQLIAQGMSSNAIMLLPDGCTYQVYESKLDVSKYVETLNWLDRKLIDAALGDLLGSDNATHNGAIKSSEVYDRVANAICTMITTTLLDLVHKIAYANFGDRACHIPQGMFSVNTQDISRQLQYGKIIEMLKNSGFISNTIQSDVEFVRNKNDMDISNSAEIVELNKEKEKNDSQKNPNGGKIDANEVKEVYKQQSGEGGNVN